MNAGRIFRNLVNFKCEQGIMVMLFLNSYLLEIYLEIVTDKLIKWLRFDLKSYKNGKALRIRIKSA